MSTTTSSNRSDAVFVTLSLGRSANAIDLLVPPAVAVNEPPDLKARCFDYLADLLLEHAKLYSSAELIAAFCHIPTSTYNASIESAIISTAVRSSFFHVDSLVGLGFRDHKGDPVNSTNICEDLSTRPPGLSYFAFRSTVSAGSIDPRLVQVDIFTAEFCLALPQTINPLAVSQPTNHALFNQTPPTSPSRPSSKITHAEITAELRSELVTH
jgi:hypothetical protein